MCFGSCGARLGINRYSRAAPPCMHSAILKAHGSTSVPCKIANPELASRHSQDQVTNYGPQYCSTCMWLPGPPSTSFSKCAQIKKHIIIQLQRIHLAGAGANVGKGTSMLNYQVRLLMQTCDSALQMIDNNLARTSAATLDSRLLPASLAAKATKAKVPFSYPRHEHSASEDDASGPTANIPSAYQPQAPGRRST
jgi:hypothetical protein